MNRRCLKLLLGANPIHWRRKIMSITLLFSTTVYAWTNPDLKNLLFEKRHLAGKDCSWIPNDENNDIDEISPSDNKSNSGLNEENNIFLPFVWEAQHVLRSHVIHSHICNVVWKSRRFYKGIQRVNRGHTLQELYKKHFTGNTTISRCLRPQSSMLLWVYFPGDTLSGAEHLMPEVCVAILWI